MTCYLVIAALVVVCLFLIGMVIGQRDDIRELRQQLAVWELEYKGEDD